MNDPCRWEGCDKPAKATVISGQVWGVAEGVLRPRQRGREARMEGEGRPVNDWTPEVGQCKTCGHPLRDHCLRVTRYVLIRLQRARKQNRCLKETVDQLIVERDTYRTEVRRLNEALKRKEAA